MSESEVFLTGERNINYYCEESNYYFCVECKKTFLDFGVVIPCFECGCRCYCGKSFEYICKTCRKNIKYYCNTCLYQKNINDIKEEIKEMNESMHNTHREICRTHGIIIRQMELLKSFNEKNENYE